MGFLSSRGADRTVASMDAAAYDQQHVVDWLAQSQGWHTELHHVCSISYERARALLRAGEDPTARSVTGATPLSLAKQLLENGDAHDICSASAAVVQATKPWSAASHHLFPVVARQRAVELLRLGILLSRQVENSESMAYAWYTHVLPMSVIRGEDVGKGKVELSEEGKGKGKGKGARKGKGKRNG